MDKFGEYQVDLVFDASVAFDFAASLRCAAQSIEAFETSRASAQSTASSGFQGYFADVFTRNMTVCAKDGSDLRAALEQAAKQVDYMREQARAENNRRRMVREYFARHDDWWEKGWDWLVGQEKPPHLPPGVPPSAEITAPAVGKREQERALGKTPGGVTSASPRNLSSAATTIAEAASSVISGTALKSGYETFSAACRYGQLQVGELFAQIDRWRELNNNDVQWLNAVAQAFTSAGGKGSVVSVANQSIDQALAARGVKREREDLDIESPQMAGINPTTGYIEDPINAVTGNFVEPELDVAFVGAASRLGLSRMYNSITALRQIRADNDAPAVGVFGLGWASVIDQRLNLTRTEGVWVCEDGRHIRFSLTDSATQSQPSGSQGEEPLSWRAEGENLWLRKVAWGQTSFSHQFKEAERRSDDYVWVVSDNQGTEWVFDPSGLWLGTWYRPGDAITVERDQQGMVLRLAHSRGRQLSIEYRDGLVVAASTSDGRLVEYRYDDHRRLIATSQISEGERRYLYNEQGLIEQVISAAGVVECVNTYDDRGRVTSQLSEYGRTTRFAYLPGHITSVSDEDGSRANTWIADARGRTVGIIDAANQRQSMAYDTNGNLVMVRDRRGDATVHFYDQRGHLTRTVLPTKAELHYEWDRLDRLCRTTSADGAAITYRYAHDNDRDPCEVIDPSGAVTRLEWADGLLTRVTDPEGVSVDFAYDAAGDLVATTNACGDTARLVRDDAGRVIQAITPLGHTTAFVYNAQGWLVAKVDPAGARWSYEHDHAGRVVAIVAPDGGITRMEYGAHGQVVKTIDPLGRSIERRFDDLGNVDSVHLPDGAQWLFNHDVLSRLERVIDPAGGVWGYAYNANGDLISRTDPTGVKEQQIGNLVDGRVANLSGDGTVDEAVEFDAYGRAIKTTNAAGDSELISYDVCGRLVEVTDADGGVVRLVRDRSGRLVSHISAGGKTTSYAYDSCGRVASVTDPAGGVTKFFYDADSRLIKRINPAGEEALYSYDVCGRLTAAQVPGVGRVERAYDACGRLTYSRDLATGIRRFKYDQAGQLIKATNGVGGVTSYAYDLRGRVVEITDPVGGVTTRTYNELDKVTSVTNPLGYTTTATYDQAGRQLTQTDPDGVTLSFEYDANGARSAVYADGRLLTRTERDLVNRTIRLIDHTDPAASYPVTHTLTYDRLGRLISQAVQTSDSAGGKKKKRVARWTYTADGQRASYTASNGHSTFYSYDPAGRLIRLKHPALGAVDFSYDSAGRLVSSTHDGVEHTWGYVDGFIATHSRILSGSGVEDVTRVTRDVWGRITAINGSSEAVTYTYDEAHQLTQLSSTSGQERQWDYDEAGHLVYSSHSCDGETLSSVDYDYDEAGQLTAMTAVTDDGVAETSYFYTDSGRRDGSVSADGVHTSYDWDARGWLKQVTVEHPDGDRLQITSHVDGLGHLARLNDTHLEWDVAAPIPVLTGVDEQALLSLPGGEYLGVPASTGAPAGWRQARSTDPQNPYAHVSADGVAGGLPPGVELTGSGGLAIAGLEWLGARLYDPATASFLTPDPFVAPAAGSMWESNPYSYAANSPLFLADPTGYKPVTDEQMQAYSQTVNTRGALAQAWDWTKNNWQYVAAGVVTVAAVASLFTPLAPLGAAALIGGGVSAAFSAGGQYVMTGSVDWRQVALDYAIGGAVSATGVGAAGVAGRMAASVGGRYVAENTASGIVDTISDIAQMSGPITPAAIVQSAVTNIGMNLATDGIAGARDVKHANASRLATPELTEIRTVPRREADLKISEEPPPWLPLERPIGRNARQNEILQQHIEILKSKGVTVDEMRVNQQQINVAGQRVGINRPDLQFTYNGQRYYFEYESAGSPRGPGHAERIKANDPNARIFILKEKDDYALPAIFHS